MQHPFQASDAHNYLKDFRGGAASTSRPSIVTRLLIRSKSCGLDRHSMSTDEARGRIPVSGESIFMLESAGSRVFFRFVGSPAAREGLLMGFDQAYSMNRLPPICAAAW